MIFQRYADLFEICSPLFWPWLWLQLAILCAQKAEDGRERLIMVSWWGKVDVLAIGSAPNMLQGFEAPAPCAALSESLSARFPGDTPALLERTEPAPLYHLQITAPAQAALPLLQDKTRILEPG